MLRVFLLYGSSLETFRRLPESEWEFLRMVWHEMKLDACSTKLVFVSILLLPVSFLVYRVTTLTHKGNNSYGENQGAEWCFGTARSLKMLHASCVPFIGLNSATFRRLYGFMHAVFFRGNKCLGVEFYQLFGMPCSFTFLVQIFADQFESAIFETSKLRNGQTLTYRFGTDPSLRLSLYVFIMNNRQFF